MTLISSFAAALSPHDVASVRTLVAHAEAFDGVGPLSEQSLLRLGDPSTGVTHLLAKDASGLAGYAQLDDRATAELVVAPASRRHGVGGALLLALQHGAGEGPLHVWAHGEHPAALALAARAGLARTRVLLQLRRSLLTPLAEPSWPEGVTVRTFAVGADEQAWLRVNNAAFAHHPEQGRWTLHDVEQREAQDWFDPKGLLLAERDSELIGFHWTKVHREESPEIGEVYVVGVRPQEAGRGLGAALTLVGLHHLRSLGLAQVLLYVDEDNTAAMKTYARLGFTRWATDVLFTKM